MGRIILTCKKLCALGVLAGLLVANPALAFYAEDEDIDAYAAAWVAKQVDNESAAAARYLALLQKKPADPAIAEALWESAIKTGDRSNAIRAAKVLELNGVSVESSLLLFADAIQKKDWKAAEGVMASLSEGNNYAFIAPLFRSWLNVAQGRPHAFPAEVENPLLGFYSGDQPAYLNLASGKFDQAKSDLRPFLTLEANHSLDLRLRAAPVFAGIGNREFALQLVTDIVPEDIAKLLSSPRPSQKAATLAPEEGIAAIYVRLAEALIEQGAPDKGLILARIASWIAPNNGAAKIVLAKSLDIAGAKNAARSVRAQIDQKSPYWARAAIAEIQQLSSDNRHKEAIALAERVALQRNSPELSFLLGQTLESAGELERAGETFARLIKTSEAARVAPQRLATYYFSLATITHKQGQWREARSLLEKGQVLDPQNAYLSNYLGYTMLEQGEDLSKALEMLRRAYRLAPESAAIADSLGWGLYLTGDYKNAIYYLEKSAKASGNDLVINEHLGDAYWRAGRKIEARYAWRIAALLAEGNDAVRLTDKINLGLDS